MLECDGQDGQSNAIKKKIRHDQEARRGDAPDGDGGVILTSRGGNPTLVRPRWDDKWLQVHPAGAVHHLMPGDAVALDKKKRAGTVLTLRGPRWQWQAGDEWHDFHPLVAATLERVLQRVEKAAAQKEHKAVRKAVTAVLEGVLQSLAVYKEVHGDLEEPQDYEVPSSAPWAEETWGMRLGYVVGNIRSNRQHLKGEDAAERRAWLDEMGFVWRVRGAAAEC